MWRWRVGWSMGQMMRSFLFIGSWSSADACTFHRVTSSVMLVTLACDVRAPYLLWILDTIYINNLTLQKYEPNTWPREKAHSLHTCERIGFMEHIATQSNGSGRHMVRKVCREERNIASNGQESHFPLQVSIFFWEGPLACMAWKETDHKEVSVIGCAWSSH